MNETTTLVRLRLMLRLEEASRDGHSVALSLAEAGIARELQICGWIEQPPKSARFQITNKGGKMLDHFEEILAGG